ncbi:MAG: HRDC domain-containing protein [Treponema sp.]|jgi:superfamily II DNA helicase RecQ|nr:HRDC domain-containing protein [Treponema sp.]
MPLLTQYRSFFISPFGEVSVTDELNSFLTSHRIVNVEKRLIDGERGTGWLFLVEFGSDVKNQTSAQRVDYRDILTAQEYALFDTLRALRKELAEKQGLPVYAVFTNEHLAGMVKKKAASPKDLAALPGVGEARVKQYGGQFLNAIAEYTRRGQESPQDPGGAGETGCLPL